MANNNRGQQQESYLVAVFNSLINTLERNNQLIKASLDTIKSLNQGAEGRKGKSDGSGSGGNSARVTEPVSKSDDIEATRADKVRVEVRASFVKIYDINTVGQDFTAEVVVHAKWEEPALKGSSKEDVDNFGCIGYWRPKMNVLNMSQDLEMVKHAFCLRFNVTGYNNPIIMMMWRFKGTFRESLELEHFPLDVQDLTLQVTSDRTSEEIELVEDEYALSTVNTKAFMDAQEWAIYQHVEAFREETPQEYVGSVTHPVLMVQCRVARRVGFFGWNIVFIVMLIMILPFTSVTLSPAGSDRLVVTITLLLTAIAFKLVVQQILPTISYLTYLDIYILAALIFLSLHAAQNSFMNYMVSVLTDPAEKVMWDNYTIIGLAGSTALFHLIFFSYVLTHTSTRRRLMKRKDRRYKAKMKFLEKYGRLPKPTEIVTPKHSDEINI
ncbi:gamma-aminobutyric acid receptor subunit beta-like [Liolophura sinensis]|uniref:gamma-aminobutyric acid receptor subunit beta-like n=1 Tax=Liolophura sinensis TaxID=3198878 RepID=UPI003158EBC4